MTRSVGSAAVVLHTHLPWLAHHGSWPVGEEWLYQAWAGAYLPVVEVLEELASTGARDVLSLGVTPVLAAMLDDPYCLAEFHTWLGCWQLRAQGALVAGLPTADYEARLATRRRAQFEAGWSRGASPVLARLADAGVVQLLGGPATHTFTPFLPEPLADFALTTGLFDHRLRLGRSPSGIWAPECAYTPGAEQRLARSGVGQFVVDGPLVHGQTGAPVDVAGSGVVALARDLSVSYRVWSPKAGYPGHPHYRDFHTFDHLSGLRPARVTSRRTPPEAKAPYRPELAAAVVARHAADFVEQVVARLTSLPQRDPLVVVAYDTELFGHWWHEGPAFLAAVLRGLPAAGVRLRTLASAAEQLPAVPMDLPAGSWGSGKDFRVWAVPEMRELQDEVAGRLLRVLAKAGPPDLRNPALDQLARHALLALASDWPFCVSKDSAAGYARERAFGHAAAFHRLADALEAGQVDRAARLAGDGRATDGPFGHLDARQLARLAGGW